MIHYTEFSFKFRLLIGIGVIGSMSLLVWMAFCGKAMDYRRNNLAYRSPVPQIVAETLTAHSVQKSDGFRASPRPGRTRMLTPDKQWQWVHLDQDKIRLRVLTTDVPTAAAGKNLGAENYWYAAQLFRQMAVQVEQPELAEKLNRLATQAHTMGDTVQQLAMTSYAGSMMDTGKTGLAHLRAQNLMKTYLSELNQGNIQTLERLGKSPSIHNVTTPAPGKLLSAFLANVEEIRQHPALGNYPETRSILNRQAGMIKHLSLNLRIFRESFNPCKGADCNQRGKFIRIWPGNSLMTEKRVAEKPGVSTTAGMTGLKITLDELPESIASQASPLGYRDKHVISMK